MEGRKQRILRAVTDDYIQTAEPVGSRTIARKYLPGVSPATIRNEMADLEEQGYLEQPHASAGRIPSDLGYRYYVDQLMERPPTGSAELAVLRRQLAAQRDLGQAVRVATRLVARQGRYASLVMVPSLRRLHVRQVQLTPVGPGHVLLLVVADPAFVYNRILDWPEPPPAAHEFDRLSSMLTELVVSLSRGFSRTAAQEVGDALPTGALREPILEALSELFHEGSGGERAYVDSVGFLLEQPEFQDVGYVRQVLDELQEPDILVQVMREGQLEELVVAIGQEQPVEPLRSLSVVMAPYGPEGRVLGVIGLVGPRRMDYQRSVAAVSLVATALSEALADLSGWLPDRGSVAG